MSQIHAQFINSSTDRSTSVNELISTMDTVIAAASNMDSFSNSA